MRIFPLIFIKKGALVIGDDCALFQIQEALGVLILHRKGDLIDQELGQGRKSVGIHGESILPGPLPGKVGILDTYGKRTETNEVNELQTEEKFDEYY